MRKLYVLLIYTASPTLSVKILLKFNIKLLTHTVVKTLISYQSHNYYQPIEI